MANPNLKHAGKKTRFTKENQPENRGRKPNLPDLRDLIAKVLGEEKDGITAAEAILSKLRQLAASGNIKAAEVLLARGYGLPKQNIDITSNEETIRTFVIGSPDKKED